MKLFRETVLKAGTGIGVQGASVQVRIMSAGAPGTGALATLYSLNNAIAANVLGNPVYTNAEGEFSFYVANGSYDLVVTQGSATDILNDVEIYDLETLIVAGGGGDTSIRPELAAATGDTMIGVQAGGTLRTKLAAMDTATAAKATSAALSASGGAALIGALSPKGTLTSVQRHIMRNFLEDIGGVVEGSGGNAVNNANAINAAYAATSINYEMRPGALYRCASLLLNASRSGLRYEGPPNNAPIIYHPAADFTRADNLFASRYLANAVGIRVLGETSGAFAAVSDMTLAGFIQQFEVNDNRSLTGILSMNVIDLLIDSVENFGMPLGVAMALMSTRGNSEIRNPFIHNNYSNTSLLALVTNAPNITGITIGGDDVNGIVCEGIRIINPRIKDLTVGAAFMAPPIFTNSVQTGGGNGGDQTDGINISSPLTDNTLIDNPDVQDVAEGVDSFGDNTRIIGGQFKNCRLFGVKLIHGGRNSKVVGTAFDRCGRAGVTISGSNDISLPIANNIITGCTITNINPLLAHLTSDAVGVLISGAPGSLSIPRFNRVIDTLIDTGPNAYMGYRDASAGVDNLGINLTIRAGINTQKLVSVEAGAGAVQLAGSPAFFTDVNPNDPLPQNNCVSPVAFPFSPKWYHDIVRVSGSGARTIIPPPGWKGVIADGQANAGVGNITVTRPDTASGNGSIAIVDGLGILTIGTPTGVIRLGQLVRVSGALLVVGTTNVCVVHQLTGTPGGAGTYVLSKPVTQSTATISFDVEGNIGSSVSYVINTNLGAVTIEPAERTNGWLITGKVV